MRITHPAQSIVEVAVAEAAVRTQPTGFMAGMTVVHCVPMCVGTAGAAAAIAKVLCAKASEPTRLTTKLLNCILTVVCVFCADMLCDMTL